MMNLTMLAALFALWLVFMSPSELVPFPAVVFVTFVGGCSSGVVPLAELIGGGAGSALTTGLGFVLFCFSFPFHIHIIPQL